MNSPGTDSNIPVRIIHATLKEWVLNLLLLCSEGERAVMQDTDVGRDFILWAIQHWQMSDLTGSVRHGNTVQVKNALFAR